MRTLLGDVPEDDSPKGAEEKKKRTRRAGPTESSSSEDSEEEFKRVRTAVKTITLAPCATAQEVRSWKIGFYNKVCAASHRTKKRTMRFLGKIERVASVRELE